MARVDLEVAERPLDAVALTVKPLVVADRVGAVRSWRDDGANAALREVVADRIGIIGLVGDEGSWRPLRQIDQRVVAFAVRRFSSRSYLSRSVTSGILSCSGTASCCPAREVPDLLPSAFGASILPFQQVT